MFNTISQKSIAGKRVNEDKIHVGENYIIFLDGASGLRKQLIPNSKSDAKWYVDEFTKTIEKYSKDYGYRKPLIRKTIKELNDKYNELVSPRRYNELNTPSASGVVLFDSDTHYFGYYFGDVKTIVKYKSNRTRKWLDQALVDLDNEVFEEATRISEKEGIPFSEAIKKCRDRIIANRELKNKEEGYYIFSLDSDAIDNINTFQIDKKKFDSILIMSDGFYSLYDSLKNKDLMDLVIKNDSDEFIHSVKKTFKKDKTFDQYQRFKLVDDISYLLLK